jgi:hypothetical protein
MPRHVFKLDAIQTRWAFSPVRTKYDYVEILLSAVKVMLHPVPLEDDRASSEMTLNIAKMSRLFFTRPQKIFSVNFPFVATPQEDGLLSFSSRSHPRIDHKATSVALGLLTEIRKPDISALDLAVHVDEAAMIDPHAWGLLLELLTLEDGYVRYDDDLEQANGDRHPRHHIDVFYSNRTTFKLGLSTAGSNEDLLDMLDVLTDCHFVAPRARR